MRRIGSISDHQDARRLCDYLQTRSIQASTDTDGGFDGHPIWIREERDVDAARTILNEFQAAPNDPKFDVSDEAEKIRRANQREQERRLAQQRKNEQKLRSRTGGGVMGRSVMSGNIPVTIAIIVISTIASFATSFGNPRGRRDAAEFSLEQKIFFAMSCVNIPDYATTGDAFISIKQGQIWRLITPMFLHGHTMHLAFNMMALYTLGSVVERIHGSWFLLGLLLASQVGGTLLQMTLPLMPLPDVLRGSPLAIGASGAVFGVFGFLWIRPRFQLGYPVEIPPINVALMLGFLVLCMTPLVPGIANGAHVGGLAIGILVAVAWPR